MVSLIVLITEHGWNTVSFLLHNNIIACARVGSPTLNAVMCHLQ